MVQIGQMGSGMSWVVQPGQLADERSVLIDGGHPRDPALVNFFGLGRESQAGEKVTPWAALEIAAVRACVNVIARSIASLDWPVWRRQEGDARVLDPSNRVYKLLHFRPNPEMTAHDLRETLMFHALLWPAAYLEIVRDEGGRVTSLWPLDPSRVMPRRRLGPGRNNELYYEVTVGSSLDRQRQPETVEFAERDIIKIKGLSYDGVEGLDIVTWCREVLGLTLAADRYGARMMSNDARPGLVLKHKGVLSKEGREKLRQSIQDEYGGRRRGRAMVLEEGMDVTSVMTTPKDAQALELRQHQVLEVCRLFNVPPHMIQDLSRATFSNIEHQSLEFAQNTLGPWARKLDQEFNFKLFSEGERRNVYCRLDLESRVVVDAKTRAERSWLLRQAGALSANEIRVLEGMNPREGGDDYLMPGNMLIDSDVVQPPQPGIDIGIDERARAAGAKAEPAAVAAGTSMPDEARAIAIDTLLDAASRALQRFAAARDRAKDPSPGWRREWIARQQPSLEALVRGPALPMARLLAGAGADHAAMATAATEAFGPAFVRAAGSDGAIEEHAEAIASEMVEAMLGCHAEAASNEQQPAPDTNSE